jgi:hypothetical protein
MALRWQRWETPASIGLNLLSSSPTAAHFSWLFVHISLIRRTAFKAEEPFYGASLDPASPPRNAHPMSSALQATSTPRGPVRMVLALPSSPPFPPTLLELMPVHTLDGSGVKCCLQAACYAKETANSAFPDGYGWCQNSTVSCQGGEPFAKYYS